MAPLTDVQWKELKKMVARDERDEVEKRFGLISPGKCATLIYTVSSVVLVLKFYSRSSSSYSKVSLLDLI